MMPSIMDAVYHRDPRPAQSLLTHRLFAPVVGATMLALVASATIADVATAAPAPLAPAVAGVSLDTDGDGLIDEEELELGTDIYDQDTDDDLVLDGEEIDYGTDPLLADTDGDGFDDATEINGGTDPLNADDNPDTAINLDGDEDGLLDEQELQIGTDPDVFDTDGDGLGDGAEYREDGWNTNPLAADTDGDGYNDGDELFTYGTDPKDADSYPRDAASVAPSARPSAVPSAAGGVIGLPSTGTGATSGADQSGLFALIAGVMAAAAAAVGLRRARA